jgi:hypothetical protein
MPRQQKKERILIAKREKYQVTKRNGSESQHTSCPRYEKF